MLDEDGTEDEEPAADDARPTDEDGAAEDAPGPDVTPLVAAGPDVPALDGEGALVPGLEDDGACMLVADEDAPPPELPAPPLDELEEDDELPPGAGQPGATMTMERRPRTTTTRLEFMRTCPLWVGP